MHLVFNVFLNGFDIYTDIKFAIDLFLLGHFQSVGRLHLAVEHNTSADVIAVLIEGGADVDAFESSHCTPLHLAILKKNDAQVVVALLEAGADVDARDYDQRTPLHLAAVRSKKAYIFKALVECSADVDARDKEQSTPLHLAARYNPSMVATLIAHKANVHLVDNVGWSPLHWAAANNHVDAIDALLKGGANVNQLDNYQ